ncbi:hypothetical protein C0993_008398 [Termitomyces sp. T159_Od127]|nr:hypothetical protein C0993_008398 [Termitomyces sp. T159_Od127]
MDVDGVNPDPPPRKRQRQDAESSIKPSISKAPRLFVPFRALGLITNYVPFVLQSRTYKGASEAPRLHILTCLGRAWALWEGGKMTLLFVGPDAPEQISSLAMDGDAVWAAAGPHALKYIRGKEVQRVMNPLGTALSFITIFGSQLLALTEDGSRMLLWNTKEGGEYIFQLIVISHLHGSVADLDATIEFEPGFTATSILHPATYLNKVLVSSSQGSIQLWNIRSQTCIHKFPLHRLQSIPEAGQAGSVDPSCAISSMVQSPAVDVVGIGFASGEISVYDVRADERLMRMFMDGGSIRALGFRSDGHPVLASASSAGHIALWDLNSGGRLLHMIRGAHDGAISALEWAPGQPVLITSGEDNSVKQWLFDSPTAAPRLLKFRSGHHAPPHLIRYYGSDGKQILTASRDRSLRCTSVVRDSRSFEMSQGSLAKKATSLSIPLASLKFPPITSMSYSTTRSKDWDDILTAHSEETFARSWTMLNKKLGKHNFGFNDTVKGKSKERPLLGSVKAVCVTACGNFGLASSSTGGIHMWNMQSGIRRKSFDVGSCPPEAKHRLTKARCITGLVTDALNRTVIASTLDGTINFFDFQTTKLDHTLVLPSAVTPILLHNDNGLLAAVCDDMVVRIIDIETRRLVRELDGFRGRILDITFSPDSRWLVATSLDSIIRTFDIPTGRLIDAFRTPSVATSITFSPTNDFLATAHVDSVGIFLWANRAQYAEISFQTVTDDDFPNVNLPSMQGDVEDEALNALNALTTFVDASVDVFSTPPQLDGELITLTLLPRARWQTLLNLEVIQQRNKPKEPPKVPEQAPFFLPTLPGVDIRFDTSDAKNVFLNIHGEVMVQNEELREHLERLLAVQTKESQRVLDLITSFGFHNASAIDSLLDKEDVQLEAILDEDDLLQECKSQNTRLIDYFQRVDVLQRLFGYVTGQIEGDDKGRFKYPYVATEVLCSEIWSIVETSINEQQQLLVPFWEIILDRSAEDMKTQMTMASHFSKINAVFLSKKPTEMFAFIRSQPRVVERLLVHVETPSLIDLIIRIIQLDEQPSGAGVLEWLSSENLMGRLIELLSPAYTSEVHIIVSDLIKGIISMATPSPGAGLSEGNGPASNRFARELALRENIYKLTSYILLEYEAPPDDEEDTQDSVSLSLPNFDSQTSSVVNSISMVIELIRKNNSDFFEPYLFHTMRNRLIQVQQQSHEDDRDTLERAMKEMADRMGVVHLGPVLEVMIPVIDRLQHYLLHPRSLVGPVATTVGSIKPLTLERWRMSELFAELLHCSNMSLLNRSAELARLYDSQGRLNGGLAGLEELAQVLSTNNVVEQQSDSGTDGVKPSLELPISGSHESISMSIDSDDSMSDGEPGSSDDEAMEEIAMYDEPTQVSLENLPASQPSPTISAPNASTSMTQSALVGTEKEQTSDSLTNQRSNLRKGSRRSTTLNGSRIGDKYLPVGERLKQRFINCLLGICAVYDVVHQILNAPVESGYNRELVISLFRDALIMHRIVDGQKYNDAEASKNNGARLGYMGHLTLMAEDVISALEHFPPELRLVLITYAPSPGWDDYVVGRYNETKRKDMRQLGGGKPLVVPGAAKNVSRWKVDEGDPDVISPTSAFSPVTGGEFSQPRGEFKRTMGARPVRENTADFGPAAMMEEPEEDQASHVREVLFAVLLEFSESIVLPSTQFARYLAQEMHTKDNDNTSDDEDDDEVGGWLSQSTFSLGAPPVSARPPSERRPLSVFGTPGFDDSFVPSDAAVHAMSKDPFNSNMDDGFGPFSDAAGLTSHDGASDFSFGVSFDDSFDDSFGDFGEFQTAETGSSEGEGSLTPTTGSWTITSSPGTDDLEADRAISISPPEARIDMFGVGGKAS